jgi:hypothetical protein
MRFIPRRRLSRAESTTIGSLFSLPYETLLALVAPPYLFTDLHGLANGNQGWAARLLPRRLLAILHLFDSLNKTMFSQLISPTANVNSRFHQISPTVLSPILQQARASTWWKENRMEQALVHAVELHRASHPSFVGSCIRGTRLSTSLDMWARGNPSMTRPAAGPLLWEVWFPGISSWIHSKVDSAGELSYAFGGSIQTDGYAVHALFHKLGKSTGTASPSGFGTHNYRRFIPHTMERISLADLTAHRETGSGRSELKHGFQGSWNLTFAVYSCNNYDGKL